MKGELLLKILEIVEDFGYTTADIVDVFLSSSKSNYLPLRNFKPRYRKTLAEKIRESAEEKREIMKEKQRIYDLLYRLQKEGLIGKSKKGEKIAWSITEKGIDKKIKIENCLTRRIPAKSYSIEPSKDILILSFDIPEKERSKRDWLRFMLLTFKFKMLQKSVWVGKIKLPHEFIDDLKHFGILNYVEIFSVGKAGTIKKLA